MDSFFFISLMCLLTIISVLTFCKFIYVEAPFKRGNKLSHNSEVVDQDWFEIVSDYLGSERKGALVVSGAWGAGKTHLFLHTIAKNLQAQNKGVKHVSLYSYGVNGKTLDDIIIQEVLGVAEVDSDSKRGTQELITGALSFFSSSGNAGMLGAAASTVGGAVKRRIVSGLESQVICFDDIDRLSHDLLLRAWAEINFFTEIKSWKVLILVDEKRLPGGSVYVPALEKNVWGTVSLDVTPRKALQIAFAKLRQHDIDSLSSIVESHLVPVVDHLGVINIRTMIMALEKVCYAARAVDKASGQEFDEFLVHSFYQKIFLCALLPRELSGRDTLIATLSGEVNVQARLIARAMQSSGTSTIEVSAEQQFMDELPNLVSLPISMPFLPEFLAKGYFPEDALISCLVPKSGEERIKFVEDDLCKLGKSRGVLEESEYLDFCNSALVFLENPPPGNYCLAQYAAIASALLEDAHYQGFERDLTEVESVVSKSVDLILAGIEAGTHLIELESFAHVNFPGVINVDVRQRIVEIQQVAERTNDLMLFSRSLENWQGDTELKLLAEAMNGFSRPVLDYIGFEAIKDFILQSNGRLINTFNWILGRRYTISGAVSVIGQEVAVLESLLDFYERYTGLGYRRVAIKSAIPMLKNAIVHAKRYRSQ